MAVPPYGEQREGRLAVSTGTESNGSESAWTRPSPATPTKAL